MASSEHVKMLWYHGYCTHHYKCHYKDFITCRLANMDIIILWKKDLATEESADV